MQELILENYMERSLAVLLTAGGIALERFVRTPISETRASLRAVIRFHDDSQLSVWVIVQIDSNGNPFPEEYSFHYMDTDNVTIFRYDNSDYHPGGENDPHHKHIGASERVIDCPQPSVAQIRDEIAAYLDREQ